MAKLNAKKHNVPPKPKARAPQHAKPSISPAEKSRIVAKANRMLNGGG